MIRALVRCAVALPVVLLVLILFSLWIAMGAIGKTLGRLKKQHPSP